MLFGPLNNELTVLKRVLLSLEFSQWVILLLLLFPLFFFFLLIPFVLLLFLSSFNGFFAFLKFIVVPVLLSDLTKDFFDEDCDVESEKHSENHFTEGPEVVSLSLIVGFLEV